MASNTLPRSYTILLSPLALLRLYHLFDGGRMQWLKADPWLGTGNFSLDGLTMLGQDLKSMKMMGGLRRWMYKSKQVRRIELWDNTYQKDESN
eukprot:10743191-Ditylum_brightwellii.AAC.1